MKETQRHIDAYNQYFLYRNQGMSVVESVNAIASKYQVSDTSVYRWMKAFDWKGKEAIQTHDVQVQVYEKTNEALSDNKAWYLKNLHEAITDAEMRKVIKIENMTDFEKGVKLALQIQGDDKHDTIETNSILRDILATIKEDAGAINRIGIKSSFDDKS